MADELLSIPINSIEVDFDDFLSPDSNKRIIFSGPFGIGKTYFLDKFFKNRTDKYLPIFLRPVNYSLLSNEDVFRLSKYDILLQLINNDGFIIENEFEFSGIEYANFFLGENKFLILQNLLKLIPKIQSTVDGLENFCKLIEAFRKGKKEINEDSDLKMLFSFQYETQDNFLLEYDHVSQFIADKLDELSETSKTEVQLKKVLIIDDLDRLDPEHIFRLFNVFSAHFDHVKYYPNGEEIKDNKFGFDKIIFVCDIENIRKIFGHKYGSGVDFSGYIDKFYSNHVYFIKQTISKEIILGILDTKTLELYKDHHQSYYLSAVRIILLFLIESNELSIRDIYRYNLFSRCIMDNTEKIPLRKLGADSDTQIHRYGLLLAIKLFIRIYSSDVIFKEKIDKSFKKLNLDANLNIDEESSNIFSDIVLFADFNNHTFRINSDTSELKYILKISDTKEFLYSVKGSNYDYHGNFKIFYISFEQSLNGIPKVYFYKLLTHAISNIIDNGIVR